MSATSSDPRLSGARAAPKRRIRLSWSDPRFRAIVWQIVIVGIVVGIGWYLVHNTNQNLAARRIATGFGFVDRVAGIPIAESLISYDPAISTYGRALWIGVLNTLKVSAVGIVLATVIGTLIGIGRLSRNWLMARLTGFYVEVIRDIPLLLQLLFWYSLLQTLPGPRQALNIGNSVFVSNRGIKVPLIEWEIAHSVAFLGLVIGIILTWLWARRADQVQASTGARPKVWPVGLGAIALLPVLIWMAFGAPLQTEYPALRGFNFQGGGTITPEYAALLIGLVTYTAGFTAEIVRSGIQAVPNGQWEAARALGLRHGVILRRIILPQALRVIIPPMTSQYLNLTKNSSLAVAIGYQDVVSLANTILNQTGQAVEGIAYIMAVYLTISLSISLFMNWYNARIALVER
jgi:general L-amino acid transport system permease protein